MVEAYRLFIVISFLFFFGGILGWFIELFFRRLNTKKNPEKIWYNPGFLTGPWLPVYGFGAIVLFTISILEESFFNTRTFGIIHYGIMFLIMAVFMTLVEYIAGKIFIQGMHIKLWDYSKEWGNFQGIICPKFTFFWGLLSAVYYFFIFPKFKILVFWFTEHPWFSFIVGIIFGLFSIDFGFAVHLGTVIRKKAMEIDRKSALDFQKLQGKLKSGKLSIHSSSLFLTNKIDQFEDFVKRSPSKK